MFHHHGRPLPIRSCSFIHPFHQDGHKWTGLINDLLGNAGSSLPAKPITVSDFVPGEYEDASKAVERLMASANLDGNILSAGRMTKVELVAALESGHGVEDLELFLGWLLHRGGLEDRDGDGTFDAVQLEEALCNYFKVMRGEIEMRTPMEPLIEMVCTAMNKCIITIYGNNGFYGFFKGIDKDDSGSLSLRDLTFGIRKVLRLTSDKVPLLLFHNNIISHLSFDVAKPQPSL